ncbi:ribosomal protein S19/S15 [Apiospora saccharicola]|uniref:Ribosomal protein S19/S15 n=1 Tax=Apiospora saccharicola TaxID=335842 RepID=A0ABR1W072_9PEZI
MQPTSLPIVRPKPGEKIKPIRTQARAATILPSFVGLKFQVHNGKVYNDLLITEDMVGHKLGEFSLYVSQPTSFPWATQEEMTMAT